MSNDHRRDDLAGDRTVDAAWRRASVEEPSARADAAILEAARGATRGARQAHPVSRPGRRTWNYWRPMAAAAAVAALAFLLVPRTEHQESRHAAPAQRPVTEMTAPAAGAAPAHVPPSRQDSATAEAAAPAMAAPAAKSEPMVPRAVDPPAESQAASVSADAGRGAPSPEQWTHRIESLYAAGDLAGATTALREFRRAFPEADSQLPPELRAWAAAVPQQP